MRRAFLPCSFLLFFATNPLLLGHFADEGRTFQQITATVTEDGLVLRYQLLCDSVITEKWLSEEAKAISGEGGGAGRGIDGGIGRAIDGGIDSGVNSAFGDEASPDINTTQRTLEGLLKVKIGALPEAMKKSPKREAIDADKDGSLSEAECRRFLASSSSEQYYLFLETGLALSSRTVSWNTTILKGADGKRCLLCDLQQVFLWPKEAGFKTGEATGTIKIETELSNYQSRSCFVVGESAQVEEHTARAIVEGASVTDVKSFETFDTLPRQRRVLLHLKP